MPSLKEFRVRIASVQSTKKITSAMKLVSAAKLRKTQDAVVRSRAYTDALRGILGQLQGGSEFSHPLLETRATVKKVRVLVIGGQRGLCGGFNTNTNRRVEALYQELAKKHPGVEVSAVLLGKKPAEYFRRVSRGYLDAVENLGDDPITWPTQEVCQRLEIDFLKGEFDELYVVYTRFRSAISTIPTAERLLPLDKESLSSATAAT